MLTACGNDYGYDRVFERPLRGLGRRGDVLFGITTSGRSPNVVRALAAAREMGIVTVGLLGGAGEPALEHCDHRPAGARHRDGAHPGMPHRARPRGAGIARGPPGRACRSRERSWSPARRGSSAIMWPRRCWRAASTVVGVDNLNAYYDVRLKQARLDRLAPQPGFAFHRLDIADRAAMAALVARARGYRPRSCIWRRRPGCGTRWSIRTPMCRPT